MEYICDRDYDYIINKYHDQNKPFNSHRRFIRHDEIFDATTGIAGDDIIAGIWEQDKALSALPHPIRKAHAFVSFSKIQIIQAQIKITIDSIVVWTKGHIPGTDISIHKQVISMVIG